MPPTGLPSLRLLTARPYDQPWLPRVDVRQVFASFKGENASIEIDARGPADVQALTDAVRQGVDVVHFDGHAVRQDDCAYLVFENRNSGLSQTIRFATIIDSLSEQQGKRQMLFCMSCCGALTDDDLKKATECGWIAGVLAFPNPDVGATDASDFFHRCYRELADGKTLQEALDAVAASGRLERSESLYPPGSRLPLVVNGDWRLFDADCRRSDPSGAPSARRAARAGEVVLLTDSLDDLFNTPDLHDAAKTLRRHSCQLHRLLTFGGRRRNFFAVVGPHDTGRTSLAKSVAAHVAWSFRAIVHVVLEPGEPALSVEAFASILLKSFPPGAQLAATESNIVAQARSELSAAIGPGILVLAEIEDPSQLSAGAIELMRGVRSPSAVLLVGTELLAPLGAQTLSIEPLPQDEALEYFVANLSTSARRSRVDTYARAMFSQVYSRIGGHPFALVCEANRITTTGDLDRLAAGPDSKPGQEAWLSRTLSLIEKDKEARRILRALSLFVGPISRDMAEAVIDVSSLHRLNELVDSRLLNRGETSSPSGTVTESFHLHTTLRRALLCGVPMSLVDEFRVFRDSQSPASMAPFFTKVWQQSIRTWASRLSAGELENSQEGGTLLDTANLVADAYEAEIRTLELRWDHSQAASALKRLSSFLWLCGDRRGSAQHLVRAAEALLRTGSLDLAEATAVRLKDWNDPNTRARGSGLLGDIRRRQGRFKEAYLQYSTALKVFVPTEDPLGMSTSYRGMAECLREAGDFSTAIAHLNRAMLILEETGHGRSPHAVKVLDRKGYVFQLLRNDHLALPLYTQAVALLPENHPDRIRILFAVADVHGNRRCFSEADAVFNEAIDMARRLGNDLLTAEGLARRARAFARDGRYYAAVDAINWASQLLQAGQGRMDFRRLRLQVEIAEAAAAAFELELSEDLLGNAEQQRFREIAGPVGVAMIRRAHALILEAAGNKLRLSNTDAAAGLFIKAAEAFLGVAMAYEDIGHGWRAGRCRLREGIARMNAGELLREKDAGDEHCRTAYDICTEIADAFKHMGDFHRQLFALRQAAQLAEMLGRAADEKDLRRRISAIEAGDESLTLSGL